VIISSRYAQRPRDVQDHYDDLDRFYREIWGDHVHHGLWLTGKEKPLQAARQLVFFLASCAGIEPGERICDVGSGYGATARLLVREYAARVTAVTLSPRQHAFAIAQCHPGEKPEYRCGDWFTTDLGAHRFDHVIAIESTEHMADRPAVFRRAAELLRPGGRMSVCAWLAAEPCHSWPCESLLKSICDEGRMPGLGSETEYRGWFADAGFSAVSCRDLSRQVRKTWSICARRTLWAALSCPDMRRYLLDRRSRNRVFALSLLRILLAYRLGAMRYGLFTATLAA